MGATTRNSLSRLGWNEFMTRVRPVYILEALRRMIKRLVSMAPRYWATGVSKASINVRVGVQHKCHFVMAPLYWMLTQ